MYRVIFLTLNFTMQSTLKADPKKEIHVALIMDGNGRWATRRGMPRTAGHKAGVDAVRNTVEAASKLGIGHLTLYAFSADNWQRPTAEVRALMQLLRRHLPAEAERCLENDIRLSMIGRRDRFSASVRKVMEDAEARTMGCQSLHVRLALDYSARDAMVEAARLLATHQPVTRELFARAMAKAYHTDENVPEVDLLIRTGGEQRLSDFLLWECAYAELYFTPCLWPDFDEAALCAALHDFQQRERRFGRVPAAPLKKNGHTSITFASLLKDL